MYDMLLKAINGVWPMIFIFTIILVSIRITYLICNKKKIILYKEILMLCFIIYLLLLYYFVTFQDNNYGTNNFIPFREIFRYHFNSRLFLRNVIGNVLLFVPLGVFICYYIKNNTIFPTLILSVLVSSSIEFTQGIIGRTADIDDVILNTVGGLIGYFIYKTGSDFSLNIPKFMKNQLFLDALTLFIILLIIYVAFKFDFWRIIS